MVRALTTSFLIAICLSGFGQFHSERSWAFKQVSAASSTLNTDLISYWKLDETSGTRVDSEPTGTAQNLTDNNTVGYTNGVQSNAANLITANSEYLSRSDSADLSVGDISFSYSVWVNFGATNSDKTVLCKSAAGNADEYGIDIVSGKPRFWIANGTTYRIVQTGTGVPQNAWTFIVGWHNADDNTVNISINNGTPTSASTSGTAPDSGGAGFRIGSYAPSYTYITAFIDEVGFWKRILTSSEITELYNSGAGKTCCPFE